MGETEDDDWQEVWDARLAAISDVLGQPYNSIYHAPHPFQLGGHADVAAFPDHRNGIAYVTVELSGKPTACYADYELMICHRQPSDWGPNVISRLAPYTQQAYIHPGDSMDIDDATPASSEIKAFVFNDYASFQLFGETFQLRLCIGITKAELKYKMDNGAEQLVAMLKEGDVYPFTDLDRRSII
jgi:hypothetical protein